MKQHRGTALAVLVLLFFSSPLSASPLFQLPVGQDVTHAGSSNPRTVQAAGNNPAAPVTSDLGGIWFGFGGVGVIYEVGPVDNLIDQADQLQENLDRASFTQQDADAIAADANAFVQELGRKGYVKVAANVQPPFLPVGGSMGFLGGTVTLGAVAFSGARVSFLDAPILVQEKVDTPGDYEIRTDTAAYGKAAAGATVSLGYSGGVLHRPDGSLFMGGRLNYYVVELSKAVFKLEDDGENQNDDAEDGLQDEFDRNRERTRAIGLDLGALWAAHNFRAGATLRNVNEPEFDYGVVGGADCAGKATPAAQRNCEAANLFASRIDLAETYTMDRQLQVETAVYTASRTWSLAATYDANAAKDATGDEYQWLSISGAFSPRGMGWIVPAVRVGYRQNQAGAGLDMVTAGLSFFRLINLDVAAATDSIENDGDEVPRSAMVSVSFELFF